MMRREDLNVENWKTTFYNDNYEVSNFGRVRRKGKNDCLKINYNYTGGYGRVTIGKSMAVHKIVALTFNGDRPEGYDINHIDGDKKNNSASNLEYVTTSENCRQACNEQGLRDMKGVNHSRTKLSPDDIRTIKKRIADGDKQIDIAKDYKVHKTTIAHIKRKKDGYYGSIQ